MHHARRAVTTILTVVALVAGFAAAQPLPTDPSLVKGELENGLRYIVKQHSVPPGRAVVWLHIHSGSLNETDQQRGIAHYLEHMAFNGSENFPPGSVVPLFQSLGMQFGRDQNAFTSFDQTTYQLSLPNVKPETLEKGMQFFADVMSKLTLPPEEIEKERQIIQEERRRSLSGRRRTGDYVMERMIPGSIFGYRMPIGTEETINAVMQDDFKNYYGKWYGASNATLMVIADTDPAEVIKVIKAKFSDAPRQPRPTPVDLKVKPYEHSFAIVASDAEIRSDEVQIVKVAPAEPPVTTVEQYRKELVRRLGQSAFNQRVSDKTARGGVPWLSVRASASNDPSTFYNVELNARANPGNWKPALQGAALELQRAREFGFTAHEIDDQKTEIMSGAERAVETESTTPAQAIVSRINRDVTDGEPTMSAQQRLDLLSKLLPGISVEEVASTFAAEFDFGTALFVAILPSGPGVPSESELLELGTRALAVKPTPEQEIARATELMKNLPTAGAVAEGAEHAASQVWSGWLSNNVRVHFRRMDQRKNDVSVNISLIGGELLEDAQDRGITSAAQLAWSRPATRNLTSTDIRELMTGKKVSVRGGGGGGRRGGGGSGDSINLSISGSPADLETGFQLAYLLLTEPKIEPASFEQFQDTSREMLQEALKNPMMLGMRKAGAAPYPDNEPRTKPLTVEQIDHLSLDAAQEWLDRLIKESPIEVVIVGDIDREKALDLAARYLGALPSRPRVSPTTYGDIRKLVRPAGPRVSKSSIDTATKQAFVQSGFYGTDETNRADVHALTMAARLLSTRMTKEVREDAQLVYSIGASSRAASTYPGFGIFAAGAPTDPEKVAPLLAKLTEMYQTFAEKGPTEEEMVVARKQMANAYEEQLKEPGYWAGRLNQLTFRGISLDDLMADPPAYQAITADQVRDTFARYYSKDNSIVVVVTPESGDGNGRTSDTGK